MTPLPDSAHVAQVLLVEDNEDHAFLTREAFNVAHLRLNLHHVDNGVKCMAFLRREPPYENMPEPDLILLDLNMPLMDGREVLAEIVKDAALMHLPVIVMSTSAEAADIRRMYALRCSSYITKPVDFGKFVKAVESMMNYWFELVVLPPKVSPERAAQE